MLALVRHASATAHVDVLTAPVRAATSGPGMIQASIEAVVNIEGRLHDLGFVLSSAAHSDPGAAAAWRDRMDVQRAAIHAAVSRTEAEGGLSPSWTIDQAVDVLSSLLSVESYERFVVQRGWAPEVLKQKIW